MNWETTKCADKVLAELPGVRAEIERHDNSIKAITLEIGGKPLRITATQYGDYLRIMVPERVKSYRVTGRVGDAVQICETFTDKSAADKRYETLNSEASIQDAKIEELEE